MSFPFAKNLLLESWCSLFFMFQCGGVNPHYSNLECVMWRGTKLNCTVLYCARLNFVFLQKRWLNGCPSRASVIFPIFNLVFWRNFSPLGKHLGGHINMCWCVAHISWLKLYVNVPTVHLCNWNLLCEVFLEENQNKLATLTWFKGFVCFFARVRWIRLLGVEQKIVLLLLLISGVWFVNFGVKLFA